jgi:hypothetical protein
MFSSPVARRSFGITKTKSWANNFARPAPLE